MCSLHILIVDEDRAAAEARAGRLKDKGFTMECACPGTEAIQLLEKEKIIDVVLLVAGESEHEALATIELFRKRFPLVEVIMLSAHATVHSAIEAIKMGAFDYLNTSGDLEQLIGRVMAAGSRKRQREAEILDIRMQPYLTEGVRRQMIAAVLERRA